ncbi:MAG: NAD-dependent epimerase/dehydratase family protein [Candidatus Promineifilaceae bacterium]
MKVFVTGGGGFLGFSIVQQLVERDYEVTTFSRGRYPALDRLNVTHVQGNLGRFEEVRDAMAGCEVVFHVAAKAGVWGSYDSYHQANVVGTENVIRACRANGIANLIFTSSPSVVYAGVDSVGGDERLPYPDRYDGFYPQTKALAERRIMATSGAALRTVSLRPHLIWGPGDTHFLPRFFERAKQGRLAVLGNRPNYVDCIYIDNAAQAHLQAMDTLLSNPQRVAGKTYFISQGEPIAVETLINRLIATGGYPPVQRRLPVALARSAGWLLETVYRQFNIKREPPLTLFTAKQLSTSHHYDISAAQRDFGYTPTVSMDEGMARLTKWVQTRT